MLGHGNQVTSSMEAEISAGTALWNGLTVGDHHNAAMEAAFAALSRANRSGRLNATAGCRIAENASVAYLRQARLEMTAEVRRLLSDGFSSVGCGSKPRERARDEMVSTYYIDFANTVENSGLSEVAKAYLYQIHNTATDEGLPAWQASSDIWAIEAQASSVLPWSEAEIVSATASVAASSVVHWEVEFPRWINEFDGGGGGDDCRSDEICMNNYNWRRGAKRVVAADVGGAVTGAVASLFTAGMTAGPAALAAGTGTSAGAVVLEVLNHYWVD